MGQGWYWWWSILGLGNSSVDDWGEEGFDHGVGVVNTWGVQDGSAGSRRYLTLARNAVPGYCLSKPNFRRPTPMQVSETWSVGPISEGGQLWLLSGEYKCNMPVAWFCTGCWGWI